MSGTTETSRRTVATELQDVMAHQFDLEPVDIVPGLRLHAIPEWSSLEHVALMAALEEHFGVRIDGSMIRDLTSFEAIEAFLIGDDWAAERPAVEAGGPDLQLGLDGVYVDTTAVSQVDGKAGRLVIRGHTVEELAERATFADSIHLVLWGTVPTAEQRTRLERTLLNPQPLTPELTALVAAMADHHPMVVVRTVLSAKGEAGPAAATDTAEAVRHAGVELVATTLDVLARHHAARSGHSSRAERSARRGDGPDDVVLVEPGSSRGAVAERFLARCFGPDVDPIAVEALDLAWSIAVDHGANASTFSARVASSTRTDLVAAVVAGFAAFAGEIHGGAVEGCSAALAEIGRPERAAPWVAERWADSRRIPGFGHRVYSTTDPRAVPLKASVAALGDHLGTGDDLATLEAVIDAMAPHRRHGLDVNVDTYLAVLFGQLGFPADYGTALYAVSRMAGWTAHVIEQRERDVLIRPRLAYHGPADRTWPAPTTPPVLSAPMEGSTR